MGRTDGRRDGADLTPARRRALEASAVPDIQRPTRRQLQAAFAKLSATDQAHVRASLESRDTVMADLGGPARERVMCREFARLWSGAGVAKRHDRGETFAVKLNVQRGAPVAGTGKPAGA